MTTTQQTVREAFIGRFKPLTSNGKSLGVQARNQALTALETLEIPGRKWEAWKYTDLRELSQREYSLASASENIDIQPFLIPGMESDLLVFVNGIFAPALSHTGKNEGSLSITPLHDLKGEDAALFESHFAQLADPQSDIFTALNTAFASEGVCIRVKKGHQAETPVQLLFLSDASEKATLSQSRNLFVVEAGASAVVVESSRSIGENTSLRNAVTEIFVGENASLEYVKLQADTHQASLIDRTEVHQSQSSRCFTYTITLGGELVRNSLIFKLDGQHVESHLLGAWLLDGLQHTDNYTQVHHMQPNGFSNELYKGIMDEKSTGVFNGRIHVYRDAQKTNAYQSNRNILLSDTANIFTKPQLEIYADDVKCSHGATTGRMDESALFYLRARGIPEQAARLMLVRAFAGEVIEGIQNEALRGYLSEMIEKRFE